MSWKRLSIRFPAQFLMWHHVRTNQYLRGCCVTYWCRRPYPKTGLIIWWKMLSCLIRQEGNCDMIVVSSSELISSTWLMNFNHLVTTTRRKGPELLWRSLVIDRWVLCLVSWLCVFIVLGVALSLSHLWLFFPPSVPAGKLFIQPKQKRGDMRGDGGIDKSLLYCWSFSCAD